MLQHIDHRPLARPRLGMVHAVLVAGLMTVGAFGTTLGLAVVHYEYPTLHLVTELARP